MLRAISKRGVLFDSIWNPNIKKLRLSFFHCSSTLNDTTLGVAAYWSALQSHSRFEPALMQKLMFWHWLGRLANLIHFHRTHIFYLIEASTPSILREGVIYFHSVRGNIYLCWQGSIFLFKINVFWCIFVNYVSLMINDERFTVAYINFTLCR